MELRMPNKIRVIFVDDEPNVLAAIRRMIRSKRDAWDMAFVESGREALALFAERSFDVIVSDIRMPGMDGGALLNKIKDKYPGVIRIALSGQVDLNEVIRSVRAVHQYVSKPCDAENLIEKIEGAFNSRDILENPEMQRLVAEMDALPVIPKVFQTIQEELRKEEPSIEVIAQHITMDVGMVAKILKLVNSPYFGLSRNIDSVFQAITMLGLETIQAIILTTHMFSMYDESRLPNFSLNLLWEHSFRVSNMARLIAECESLDTKSIARVRMAGLLHDVGKLMLASSFPDKYAKVLNMVARTKIPVWKCEQEVFGTIHAHLGAYIMGLWGMAGDIVHGIGYHHDCRNQRLEVCSLISVADFIDHHCVVINKEYVRTDLESHVLPRGEEKQMLDKWITYINDNWDGVEELQIIDDDILAAIRE